MAVDGSRGPSDDHLVADVAPGLRPGRDAPPALPPPHSPQGSTRPYPARRVLTQPLAAIATVAILLAGCDRTVPATQPAGTPATTASPTSGAPGQLHMTMQPAYDARRVELAYLVDGERIEGESIDQDVEVIVNRPFPPGTVRIEKNGVVCAGSLEIVSGMETDVLLDVNAQPDRCEVFSRETHPTGSIQHPELPLTSAVGAFVPLGLESVFVVRSLDDLNAAPIAEVTIRDPPWEAEQIVVQPGRYETSVLVDGVVIATDTVELERGEDRIMFLRVLPPDVPRDCGDIPGDICEQAIIGGYAGGLFQTDRMYVTAARLRPSQYSSCMGPFVGPLYDVVFEMANPRGELTATVGQYENGRFDACTY
jgi:hypothetical protein